MKSWVNNKMKKKILLIYDRDLMPFTFFRRQEIKYYKMEAKFRKNKQVMDKPNETKRQSKNFLQRYFR